MLINAPTPFDATLLCRHIKTVTGIDVFRLMYYDGTTGLNITSTSFDQTQQNAINAAVASYAHPADVGAERSITDIVMER